LDTKGKLTLGRKYYNHGHYMVMNNQMDAINYTQKVKDISYTFNLFYNRQENEDYRNIWNINIDTKRNGHDLYLGLYYLTMDSTYLQNNRQTVDRFNAANPDDNKDISRYYIEFGGKGKIGNSENWSYDLGGVFEHTENGKLKEDNTREDTKGWMIHAAAKYDTKKDFKFKLAYTMIDEEANAGYIAKDKRWTDSPEHPMEDLIRDRQYNRLQSQGFITNVQDIKVQVEYTPKTNDKHYFRLAYDILSPKDDDKASVFFRRKAAAGQPESSDGAKVITFEYKYKLAKNTRIRIGYTDFKYDSGNAFSDYNMFWTELYVKY
jgi:hypothetical protein